MQFKLESFSRQITCLHVTVSVHCDVSACAAGNKRAWNRLDVKKTSRSPIRAGHAKNRPIQITGQSIGASQIFTIILQHKIHQ